MRTPSARYRPTPCHCGHFSHLDDSAKSITYLFSGMAGSSSPPLRTIDLFPGSVSVELGIDPVSIRSRLPEGFHFGGCRREIRFRQDVVAVEHRPGLVTGTV